MPSFPAVPAAAGLSLALAFSPVTAPAQEREAPPPAADATGATRAAAQALASAIEARTALVRAGREGVALETLNRAIVSLTAARAALLAESELAAPAAGARKRALPPAPDVNTLRLALDRGLRWLHVHQDQDGKWDCDGFMKHDLHQRPSDGAGNPVHDVGVTGLAVLALLADGNTTAAGQYQDTVRKAVAWLQSQQNAGGLFGTPASHDFVYGHAIATVAMCEAYGRSKAAALRDSAQRGIDYLEAHRNPYGCWRYRPRDNDNDSSVTGWCVKAYCSGRVVGLNVNKQALRTARAWYDEVTDPATGRTGYTKRGEPSSRHPGDHARRFPVEKGEALTALGLGVRFALGQAPERTPVMFRAADRLLDKLPDPEDKGAIDHYYWFHGTVAMAQMGAEHRGPWARAASAAMLATQATEGGAAGSWDARGVWGDDGGRVYSTALMLLGLHTVWRQVKIGR